MCIDYIPVQNKLTVEGALSVGMMSREQYPAQGELPAAGFTLGGNLITGGPSSLINAASTAPHSLDGYAAMAGATFPATDTFRVLWRFEDAQDFVYRTTTLQQDQVYANVTDFTPSYSIYDRESVFATPSVYVSSGGFESPWALPGGIESLDEAPLATQPSTWTVPDKAWTYPSVYIVGRGLSHTTTVMRAKITINWEGLPLLGTTNLSASSPSPSNPDELTQAANAVQHLPVAFTPNNKVPTDPGANAAVKGIAAGANDLYNGTPRKEAIEGTSILKKIAKFGGKALLGLLPIPGVSAIGGALIDAL
jgi:hypothetical protein